MLRELMLELIRADVITGDVLGSVERRFEGEARANAGNSRAERYAQLAHMARLLPIEAAAPTTAEFHAGQRRRQLHIIMPDGGNNGS
jgi:hypothetical protein